MMWVKGLMDEFAESLTNSDQLIVTDIYAASEEAIKGVSGRILCNRVRKLTLLRLRTRLVFQEGTPKGLAQRGIVLECPWLMRLGVDQSRFQRRVRNHG